MAFEELNEKNVELEDNTPGIEIETAPAEEIAEEVTDPVEAETAESEEAVEVSEPEETPVQDFSAETEEPAPETVPETVEEQEADADLSEAFGEEIDFDFEVEETPSATEKITAAAQQVRNNLQDKYDEARSACKSLMERISNDLEQTNYNPYIRSTTTRRYEILRNSQDTDPVDVFEFESTSGYSLRAMAITAAIVAAADIAVARLFKKH